MNNKERYLLSKIAKINNFKVMILCLLLMLTALSVGLAFFLLVPGAAGFGVGIAMFCVAGLALLIGEINYFATRMQIERAAEE